MSGQRPVIKRVLGFYVGIVLLLGLFAPIAGAGAPMESDGENTPVHVTDKVELQNETWVIDGETEYLNGSDKGEFIMDKNIEIINGGKLVINNATLTFTIDGFNPWSINLDDGELVLWNSVLRTTLPEGQILRPFLKTEVVADSGSSVVLREGSSFKFPGWVRLLNSSELIVKDSSFDSLDEVPDYDYTWGYGDRSTGIRDNENCPMLIAEDSEILMEDSEINDYYTNTALNRMIWYASSTGDQHDASDDIENPVVGPGETMHIDEWTLDRDQMDFPAKDYPYHNPTDKITALYLVAEYTVGEDYDVSQPIEYRAPGGVWEEADVVDSSETDIGASIWELELDQFYRDQENDTFWHDVELRFENGASGNASVLFDQLNLVSAYENDIRLENTEMDIINSFIDIDFRSADVDPRDTSESTTPDTYLQDSRQEHRVIRAYEGSDLKAYGLTVTEADQVPPDGDPAILDVPDSSSQIYRWAHVQAQDNTGTSVSGAEIQADFEDFDPTDHVDALNYRDKKYPGEYQGGADYTTGENGKVAMILKSDELDHPSNWPNGRYMGGYSLEGTYEDEYIGEHTATRDIGLASFPTLTKNSNNHNTNMTFDMELPLPNFNVYDGDLTIDGESDPGELVVNGTVQVGLQVRNEGEVPATDVLVEFYLDEQIIESQEIDLDGGEEDDIEFQWTPEEEHQGSDRVLTARVDPYDEIEEHDRENNEVSVTFDVLGRPDLRVEEISLEGDYTEGNNIMEGEDVLVSAIVANRGETGVEGVYSEVSIVSKDDNESESLGDELVSLSPEETREVGPFTWENPSTGNYSLKGVIDPDDEVDESDYRYNELERDASVLMAPDLTPEELTFSEDPVRIGNDVEITATITNQGEWTSEEMTVNFYVDDESEPFATRDRGGFSGGTSREVTVDWTAEMTVDEKEEMREITVSVEPDPNERDETNQELSKEITIERHRALVIEGVTTDPESEAIKGELVEVTASVKNVGDIGVDELEIVLRSEEDGEISRKNISEGLIVGESREINFIWDTSNVEPGYRNLIVEIPEDDVNEKGFTVSLPPRLDFVSTAWEVWSMEEEGWQELEDNESLQLEEKDDLRFNTTIENTGDALLSEGTVQITYPDGTWVNKTIEIGPGETVVVTDEWAAEIGENGGEMDITVRLKPSPNPDVEPYDSISQAVTIDPLDVRITDIVIPEDPAAGETYSFEGTLTRESDGMALRDTEVRVAIVSDGEELTSAFGTTDSEGRFLVTLQIPEGSGEYDVVFEPQTHNLQTVEESITVEEEVSGIFGIPWWLFIVIIAAAGGGVGSLFAYFKFFGPEEVVECGNCGASISADSTTCPNCGVEFDMDTVKCSECGEWIPATSDSCPECGAEFIKTGEEVEDYTDRMRKQYEKFVSQRKQRAESKLGRSLSKKEFLDWWRQQPSFVTFDQWLERKEKQRKEGGQECPNCGTLNSVDDAVCQKCGTSLVTFEEKETGRRSLRKQPGGESSETERSQGEAPRPPTEDELKAKDQGSSESTTRRSESKKDKRKRVKKKPKKRVKKKVVRDKEED